MVLPKYSEIAERTNVSTMTVSNVIRGKAGVSKQTRERVLETMKEMGVPQSRLPQTDVNNINRKNAITLLYYDVPEGASESPVYMDLQKGILQRCSDLGYALQVLSLKNKEELINYCRGFDGKGLLALGQGGVNQVFQEHCPGLPCVRLMNDVMARGDSDSVIYDDLHVGELAADYLKSHDCQKVAYLGLGTTKRLDSFLAAAQRMSMKAKSFLSQDLQLYGSDQVLNHEALAKLWGQVQKYNPQGLFLFADQIAFALQPLLLSQQISPGKDIHIISCNGENTYLKLLHPRPASVNLHTNELGRRAVDQLLWRLDNPNSPAEKVILRPSLLPGSLDKQ